MANNNISDDYQKTKINEDVSNTNLSKIMAMKAVQSGVQKSQQQLIASISSGFNAYGMKLEEYQKICLINAISLAFNVLAKEGLTMNDVDLSSMSEGLQMVALLRLNAANNEVYCKLQNEKRGTMQNNTWVKVLQFCPQGNGFIKQLSEFGKDVAIVGTPWEVRENDKFEYPSYSGFNVIPPKWTPSGKGKVVRIVFPIKKTDGSEEYLISEREDVAKNLQAHILNNIKDVRSKDYSDNAPSARDEMMIKLSTMSLDDMLNDKSLKISPAWRSPSSRESMIVRKMENNAVKKYPKDFNKFGEEGVLYSTAYGDSMDSDDIYKDDSEKEAKPALESPEDHINEEAREIKESGKKKLNITDVKATSTDVEHTEKEVSSDEKQGLFGDVSKDGLPF